MIKTHIVTSGEYCRCPVCKQTIPAKALEYYLWVEEQGFCSEKCLKQHYADDSDALHRIEETNI